MRHWSPPWCAGEALRPICVPGARAAAVGGIVATGRRALVSSRDVLVVVTSSFSE
jgi:hypothetical protein